MAILDQLVQNAQRDRENSATRTQHNVDQSLGLLQSGMNAIGARQDASQERERQQAELNRPVAAPVSNLLNALHAKMQQGSISGTTAATLMKLVKAGKITEEQATAQLDGIGGSPESSGVPDQVNPATSALSGVPPVNAGRPLNTSIQVREPGGAVAPINSGAPQQQLSMPPPPVGMTQGSPESVRSAYGTSGVPSNMYASAPQAAASRVPPPMSMGDMQTPSPVPPPQSSNHQWTVRDVNDLRNAGGFPQERGKSEMDYMLELLKEQGRGTRNTETVEGRQGIADDKLNFEKKKLGVLTDKWQGDRDAAMERLILSLKNIREVSFGRGSKDRLKQLLTDARSNLNKLRDNDTRLRNGLPAMLNDPSIKAKLYDSEQEIKEAETELETARTRVETAIGEEPPTANEGGNIKTSTPANPITKPLDKNSFFKKHRIGQ